MENKITAVEWLFEQIARRQGSILHTIPFYNENQDLLIQAKQMEKEQNNRYYNSGKCMKIYKEFYGGNNGK